jgi:hypothetical protein
VEPNKPDASILKLVSEGTGNFPFFGWGPNSLRYADRLTLRMVRLRGQNIFYFKKIDVPARIDGHTPLSNNPNRGDFDPTGRAGSALYGEPIHVGRQINSVSSEVTPVWNYAEPIKLRGVALNPVQSDTPDERGHILTLKLNLEIPRALCDEFNFVPCIGDVVCMPQLLDNYYDVSTFSRDAHRWGSSGFFTSYTLQLVRNSIFVPERKNLPTVKTEGVFTDIPKEVAKEEAGRPPTLDGESELPPTFGIH